VPDVQLDLVPKPTCPLATFRS